MPATQRDATSVLRGGTMLGGHAAFKAVLLHADQALDSTRLRAKARDPEKDRKTRRARYVIRWWREELLRCVRASETSSRRRLPGLLFMVTELKPT